MCPITFTSTINIDITKTSIKESGDSAKNVTFWVRSTDSGGTNNGYRKLEFRNGILFVADAK